VVYFETELYDQSALQSAESVTPVHPIGEGQQIAFINFSLNKGDISEHRQQVIAGIIRRRMPINTGNPPGYVRGVCLAL
jgi:hypothetical protein